MKHGTTYGYNTGCRCGECKEAAREKKRRWRQKRGPAYLEELARNRERKRTYTGICERCGGETRYNGHSAKGASRICITCARTFTHCAKGHPLTPDNRLAPNQGYSCRLCRNEYARERSRRLRREAGVPEIGQYRRPVEEQLLTAIQSEEAAP